MIHLAIDDLVLDRLAAEVRATDDQVRRALNSTVRRLNTTMRREAMRQMSQATGLPQKRFSQRIRSFKLARGNGGWKVFIGLDSLNLLELGAHQAAGGIEAKGQFYQGAFFGLSKGTIATVFKRKGKARLPIQQVRKDISPIGDAILASAERIFNDRFFKVLEHELKWRTQTLK